MGTPRRQRVTRPKIARPGQSADDRRDELASYLRAAFVYFHGEAPTFRRALNRVRREGTEDAWRAVADTAVEASRQRLHDAAKALESSHSGTMQYQQAEKSRFEQVMLEDPEGNGLACYLHAAFFACDDRSWGFDRILRCSREDPGEPWRHVAQMAASAALRKTVIQ